MKFNGLKEIGFREFIILIIVLIVAIDVFFIKAIMPTLAKQRAALLSKCNRYESKIYSLINSIESRKDVFRKIAKTKEAVETYKEQISLLKNKKVSILDVGNMIKALFLKSGINVMSFKVEGIENQRYRIIYKFNVKINDTLENIVYFLDTVENYSNNMQIPSYEISKKDDIYNAKLKIEYVQVNMQ
ncbi:hypothetical protein [Hippea maritima]|uniref:Uncharacterized protein n=1 Tax=Hippea maritima (strain ATCC 700847 / DSM 10411 / MH2) TaxID=760142 RepID=F2LWJ8_HIPMA|nr:hypothetical protein [Hippea maritima]AEA34107.1 hypothetical protein Hipma_1141 [Hippea maritima DSM 10411]